MSQQVNARVLACVSALPVLPARCTTEGNVARPSSHGGLHVAQAVVEVPSPVLDGQAQLVAAMLHVSETQARIVLLHILRTWDNSTLWALRIERAQVDGAAPHTAPPSGGTVCGAVAR